MYSYIRYTFYKNNACCIEKKINYSFKLDGENCVWSWEFVLTFAAIFNVERVAYNDFVIICHNYVHM